jgi:DNA methylase/MerR HTH family regulatory protein
MQLYASVTDTIFSTAQVARKAGIDRDTLLRWLRIGSVPEPQRERRGWRFFTSEQLDSVVRFAHSETNAACRTFLPDLSKLEAIDWDFHGAKTSYLTHGLHPYPAKFIPQIPNALIQTLSNVGETVADIFCGSGTTLVEALMLKRNAIGIDANPLACMISKAKTTCLQSGDAELLESLAERASDLADAVGNENQFPLFSASSQPFRADAPSSKTMAFWFEAFVIKELAEILSWCDELPTSPARMIARTAFSSIIVSVSKQDSDTRYVRREKNLHRGDTCRRFAKALLDAREASTRFTELVEPRFNVSVHDANLLERPDIGTVDLIVCSPPYPNAYSYHLYHMRKLKSEATESTVKRDRNVQGLKRFGRRCQSYLSG